MSERKCLNCENIIPKEKSKLAKFCCKYCTNKFNKDRKKPVKEDKFCLNCGELINRSNNKLAKFCSKKCNIKFHSDKKINIQKCDICKENDINRYIVGKINKCKMCSAKERHEKSLTTLQCDFCNKHFNKKNGMIKGEKNYCSRICSSESQKKPIFRNCSNCNSEIIRNSAQIKNYKTGEEKKNLFCSVECMGEFYSKEGYFTGENNHMWLGGDIDYYGANWKTQRNLARKRDNYTCEMCSTKEEERGKQLSVHHIIPFRNFQDYKQANILKNLTCLCESCHRKTHSEMIKNSK